MSKIIAISNFKGGVGKSVTAINLSASLTHFGKTTLLIDLDPQANSTKGLGYDSTILDSTIYEVLKNEININLAIKKTSMENFDLIPSKLILGTLDQDSFPNEEPLKVLSKSLQNLDKIYDYIILDCPSSMSFLTLNCLSAANSVVIPVQCEPFALDATKNVLSRIINVQTSINPNLEIEGFLITMYDSKLNLSVEIANEIRNLFKEDTFLLPVPRTVSIPESNRQGLPVILFRPTSSASNAFFSMAREIIDKEISLFFEKHFI